MRTHYVRGVEIGVAITDELDEAVIIKVDDRHARAVGIPTLIVRGSEGQVNYAIIQIEAEYEKERKA